MHVPYGGRVLEDDDDAPRWDGDEQSADDIWTTGNAFAEPQERSDVDNNTGTLEGTDDGPGTREDSLVAHDEPVTAPQTPEAPSIAPTQPDVAEGTQTAAEEAVRSHELPYPIDTNLLNEIFGPPPAAAITDAQAEDLISSTSTRKALYRLTRPESLREHNSGDTRGYVRVAWHGSRIRDDVLKTVARWNSEGRVGRVGAGRSDGRSMFGWDEPARPVSWETPPRASKVPGRSRASTSNEGQVLSPTGIRKSREANAQDSPHFAWSNATQENQKNGRDLYDSAIDVPAKMIDESNPDQNHAGTGSLSVASVPVQTRVLPLAQDEQSQSDHTELDFEPLVIENKTTEEASNDSSSADQRTGEDDDWGEMQSSIPAPSPDAVDESAITSSSAPYQSGESHAQSAIATPVSPQAAQGGWSSRRSLPGFDDDTPALGSVSACERSNPPDPASVEPLATFSIAPASGHVDAAVQRILDRLPDFSYMSNR